MRKTFLKVYVALTTLFVCPTCMMAGTPSLGSDDDDEIPIIVHGPHRAPQKKMVAQVEYNADSRMVEITFCKSLADASVYIYKNGIGVMACYLGDAPAGSEYEIPFDIDGDSEGLVLYIVSGGIVFSVNSLD